MATMAGCEALVAHSASFDMQVLGSAAMRHEVAMEELTFACTRIFARRWWPGWSSYGLAHVTDRLDLGRLLGGINHHDALWDASAAMIVAERGLQQYGFASWDQAAHEANLYLGVVGGPRYLGCGTRNPGTPIVPRRTQGPFDSENPLYEKTVCFTGALSRFTRRDAAQLAVDAGAFFSAGVTKKTDLLVVGTQDLAVLNGYAYSGKMRRAATMAEQGHHIEIISEDDFYRMIAI
jgi:DNA polymerase-3 subunit epsilon